MIALAPLNIQNLNVRIATKAGMVMANNGIDLSIRQNENMGLIGETGCGKSILGHALMGLLPETALVTGRVVYNGKNLLELSEEEMRNIRGRQIAMIFQNPRLALNPVLTIYQQIMEIYRYRLGIAPDKIGEKTYRLLEMVGIDPGRIKEYPHQFSGGMLQRAMIAMAIAFHPELMVADEITKGLDRIVKWKIVNLIKDVTKGCGMLLITHDLHVAKYLCGRIAVMYAGEIVEINRSEAIFSHPMHPYTKGLINALPSFGMRAIPGHTPSLTNPPRGCRFHPRCINRKQDCLERHPKLKKLGTESYVRCI